MSGTQHESPIVYLACPYSDPDPEVRRLRFELANLTTVVLIREGRIVFSPISHSHPLSRLGLPGDWKFWEPMARAYLKICRRVAVLTLPGWENSVGVQRELDIASQLAKPISYLNLDDVLVAFGAYGTGGKPRRLLPTDRSYEEEQAA